MPSSPSSESPGPEPSRRNRTDRSSLIFHFPVTDAGTTPLESYYARPAVTCDGLCGAGTIVIRRFGFEAITCSGT